MRSIGALTIGEIIVRAFPPAVGVLCGSENNSDSRGAVSIGERKTNRGEIGGFVRN